jgi:hypothetical protein
MVTDLQRLVRTSVTRLKLVNPRGLVFELLLEPWGETFPMPAGATFDIVAEGPADGELEITVEEACITVWGWTGSTVRLFHDGRELGKPGHSSVPVPGMSSVSSPTMTANSTVTG